MQHADIHLSRQPRRLEDHTFPKEFLWGASTSAYQIEGAIHEDGRGPTIWDHFAATPGATYQGATGEIAVDHYHRSAEDVALMSDIGLTSYCFSLAWSRILPEGTGAVNRKGLDFYDRLLDRLLARGITPVVKLYHWDLPLALYRKGGWANRDTVNAFVEYAAVVANRLGDRVPYWVTHNEPWCAAYLGHGIGVHAPGEKQMQSAIDVAHHLLLSHGQAVQRLRQIVRPDAHIGIALNLFPISPIDERPDTLAVVPLADAFWNTWFLDPLFRGRYRAGLFAGLGVHPPPIHEGDMETIAVPLDFLAINYYMRMVVRPVGVQGATMLPFERIEHLPGSAYTDMGWEIYPQGLTDTLVRVHREYMPRAILITENGSAFADAWQKGEARIADPHRREYLHDHIQAVADARAQGVPVMGYYAWSLLDNFEWDVGYSRRFGLVYVDYLTQQRILKDSGRWYATFLAQQALR